MIRIASLLTIALSTLLCNASSQPESSFEQFMDDFAIGYRALRIPTFTLSYQDYFSNIPDVEQLEKQQLFFEQQQIKLTSFQRASLQYPDNLYFDHLQYEIILNLRRIQLEKDWIAAGRPVPKSGLSNMPNSKALYAFFVQKFTSTTMTPEEVFAYGKSEVARVQQEIQSIQQQLGYQDSTTFYQHLESAEFFLTDKAEVIAAYAEIDQQARNNLHKIISLENIPSIVANEWPAADADTPPGIYRPGQGVFQFNFHNKTHNKRAMEWLYMHEAIPGHHLQWTVRDRIGDIPDFQRLFFYFGNAEGWGCYVEYLGKEMGFFSDPYAYLGKWEWDLVRSARLVMEVGIHYYGWSKSEAMTYWQQNIIGQDEIAEREITRITNWPGQALCYKVGAHYIQTFEEMTNASENQVTIQQFHQEFLNRSYFPLEVLKQHFQEKTR